MFQSLCSLIDTSSSTRKRPSTWTHVATWDLGHDEHENVSLRRRRNGDVLLKIHIAPVHARDVFLTRKGTRLSICNVGKKIRVVLTETNAEGFMTIWLKLTNNKQELAHDAVEFLLCISTNADVPQKTMALDVNNETESD